MRRVVVVGGGAAGWLTAGLIAAKYQTPGSEVQVTLVESPDIANIGVGEGTWPTMRTTLQELGINEFEFIQACDVSLKQASCFNKWVDGSESDIYYHPFSLPEDHHDVNLVPKWQKQSKASFADFVNCQPALIEQHKSPKAFHSPEFNQFENYGYHLNAGKFTDLLTRHCTKKLNVKHVLANVMEVKGEKSGDILAISTKEAGDIQGDLFIDCTGFAGKLIKQFYGVPFVSKKDQLFIDRALAVQVPYATEQEDIKSATISTAQSAGWIWDIGLASRRGVGHVYSSQHQSKQGALDELKAYLAESGHDINNLSVKSIEFEPGYLKKFWVNNCVAVGMSSGFLEPLEASALIMVEMAAKHIAMQLPAHREAMDVISEEFNQLFAFRWQRIVDFIKLHYVLSKRQDSDFWRANREQNTISDTLKKQLKMWKHQAPIHNGFLSSYDMFQSGSYQFILYGMGFETNLTPLDNLNDADMLADKALEQLERRKQLLLQSLPTNREYVEKINSYDLNSDLDLSFMSSKNWAVVSFDQLENIAKFTPIYLKLMPDQQNFQLVTLLGFHKDEVLVDNASFPALETLTHSDNQSQTHSLLTTKTIFDLLKPIQIQLSFKHGDKCSISGLFSPDHQALNRVSSEQREQIIQSGLAHVFTHIDRSASKMKDLIMLKNEKGRVEA